MHTQDIAVHYGVKLRKNTHKETEITQSRADGNAGYS